MDWVSFDEIKTTVTLQMAIEHYGVPLRRVGPHNLRGKCPLPSHSSKESKESFIATLDKGIGGAWSCHSTSCASARSGKRGGNVLDFVAAMEKCSIRDAAIKLQTWFLVPAAGQQHAPAHTEPPAETNRVGREPEPGSFATEEIADRLQSSIFRVTTVELDHGVQPDQLSCEQLHAELDPLMG